MILVQKKPLSNILAFTIPFLSLLILFLFFVTGKLGAVAFFLLVFFSCGIIFVFRNLRRHVFYKFHGEFDRGEEEINLLTGNIKAKKNILETFPARQDKVSFLFDVSEHLVELCYPEEISGFLIKAAADLFPFADSILFFLLKNRVDSLTLVSSWKKAPGTIIAEKHGDILDKWVIRHNQSLLVEDIMRDFRFDYTQIVPFRERKAVSFISSPLSVGDKVMGALRVESSKFSCFSLGHLRLLRSICDLGVLALERANLFQHTEELAIKDSLTHLFLKDYFFDRLKQEIKRAQLSKVKLGLAMLDIDDFKEINDRFGHIVGDIVLKRLAKILRQAVGGSENLVSRFGGEEFFIFCVETSRQQLLELGELIRQEVEKAQIVFRRRSINFTVSLGLALFPDDAQEVIDLVDKTDQRLYQAKREGKNRLCF